MKSYKSHEFENEKESQDLTYVLFKDNWCSLCRDVRYILDELSGLGHPVYVVDVAENPDLMEKYSICEVPTVVVFRKGRIVSHLEGKLDRNKYFAFS